MQSLEPEREKSLPRTLLGLLEKQGCPSTPLGGEPPCGSRGTLASQRIWSQGNRESERSGSGSPDIASLNFLASRLASLRPLLQKKVGRRREIKLRKGHKAKPGSASTLFPPRCSFHFTPGRGKCHRLVLGLPTKRPRPGE